MTNVTNGYENLRENTGNGARTRHSFFRTHALCQAWFLLIAPHLSLLFIACICESGYICRNKNIFQDAIKDVRPTEIIYKYPYTVGAIGGRGSCRGMECDVYLHIANGRRPDIHLHTQACRRDWYRGICSVGVPAILGAPLDVHQRPVGQPVCVALHGHPPSLDGVGDVRYGCRGHVPSRALLLSPVPLQGERSGSHRGDCRNRVSVSMVGLFFAH